MPSRSDALNLALYNGLACLLSPFLLAKKAMKYRRFRHAYEWDKARWQTLDKLPASKPSQRRIAMVALGWAEVTIIDSVSKKLEEKEPEVEIVWMIRDVEARRMAEETFPDRIIVPMPFDFSIPVHHFLKNIQPTDVVLVEKFWWPNLIWGAKLSGSRVILINGRSRGRARARYKLMSSFQRWILRAFDLLIFESESQKDRVADVLPKDSKALSSGNIKWSFQAPPPPPDSKSLKLWLEMRPSNQNGPLPILFAGSTDETDDEWCLSAWQEVRKTTPCALVLAPRRVARSVEVSASLGRAGLPYSLRSAPVADCEILLLDSMGELAYAYNYASAAYVGGAVSGRGHNIIEPLLWGVPVAYGPNRGDFEAAQKTAEEWGVGFRLHNANELASFWHSALFSDSSKSLDVKIQNLIASQRGAMDLTVDSIVDLS